MGWSKKQSSPEWKTAVSEAHERGLARVAALDRDPVIADQPPSAAAKEAARKLLFGAQGERELAPPETLSPRRGILTPSSGPKVQGMIADEGVCAYMIAASPDNIFQRQQAVHHFLGVPLGHFPDPVTCAAEAIMVDVYVTEFIAHMHPQLPQAKGFKGGR